MQQHSGFENRFIDTYQYCGDTVSGQAAEVSHYAPVFKSGDSLSLTVFPGIKTAPFSSAHADGNAMPAASITLPVALLVAALLFVVLKNTLKSSVGSIFLIGISPKWLQETERRQIERNTLIINSINAVSFFSLALVLYALALRFDLFYASFALPNIPENLLYISLFAAIIGIIFLFFYARSGFIALFGSIFSVPKTMKAYQKPYKLLFVSLSPILLLITLFLAFAPHSLIAFPVYFLLAIAVCYLIFIVISIAKFLNFTNRYTIHIFLYLCTLEILPFLVMVKLMQNVYF